MEVINIRNIKKGKIFNYGSFSFTYKVNVGGIDYIYKEYIDPINPIVKDTIISLSEKGFSNEFLTPKYLVETKNGQNIIGYLTMYHKNLVEIDEVYDYYDRVKLLKDVRNNIEKWHKESKRIHGDINLGNILVDEDKMKSYLIDFDTSLKYSVNFEKLLKKYNVDDYPFSSFAYDYLSFYPFNEELDIYLFNLNTMLLLTDNGYLEFICDIINNDFYNLNNKNVKRLCKKFLFEDTKKSYGKEYIIDYIN